MLNESNENHREYCNNWLHTQCTLIHLKYLHWFFLLVSNEWGKPQWGRVAMNRRFLLLPVKYIELFFILESRTHNIGMGLSYRIRAMYGRYRLNDQFYTDSVLCWYQNRHDHIEYLVFDTDISTIWNITDKISSSWIHMKSDEKWTYHVWWFRYGAIQAHILSA